MVSVVLNYDTISDRIHTSCTLIRQCLRCLWRDPVQEMDIFVCMKARHHLWRSSFSSLQKDGRECEVQDGVMVSPNAISEGRKTSAPGRPVLISSHTLPKARALYAFVVASLDVLDHMKSIQYPLDGDSGVSLEQDTCSLVELQNQVRNCAHGHSSRIHVEERLPWRLSLSLIRGYKSS